MHDRNFDGKQKVRLQGPSRVTYYLSYSCISSRLFGTVTGLPNCPTEGATVPQGESRDRKWGLVGGWVRLWGEGAGLGWEGAGLGGQTGPLAVCFNLLPTCPVTWPRPDTLLLPVSCFARVCLSAVRFCWIVPRK